MDVRIYQQNNSKLVVTQLTKEGEIKKNRFHPEIIHIKSLQPHPSKSHLTLAIVGDHC